MLSTREELATSMLSEIDKDSSWQDAVRELRQAVVLICGLIDDLEQRLTPQPGPAE
jgi:hypothetical protein